MVRAWWWCRKGDRSAWVCARTRVAGRTGRPDARIAGSGLDPRIQFLLAGQVDLSGDVDAAVVAQVHVHVPRQTHRRFWRTQRFDEQGRPVAFASFDVHDDPISTWRLETSCPQSTTGCAPAFTAEGGERTECGARGPFSSSPYSLVHNRTNRRDLQPPPPHHARSDVRNAPIADATKSWRRLRST